MSFFNTSASLVHSSKLPNQVSQKQGITMLHDHEFFMQCNPHMEEFDVIGQVSDAALPDGIEAQSPTTSYKVIDKVATLPKGIWDSTVESTYEFTNTELGLFVRIKSPLNVVMDTVWEIRESDSGLELVEDSNIKCSRLLIGVVKSLNEGGWSHIHDKMLNRLRGETQGSGTNVNIG
ncbi:hypothetical protein VMCG_00349 [Cytospora schulzeri]|uniref:DUF7053 domain-containing protein n=1 Tax=Cytospora schulzeri TaxID=448051 RepID=A0A423X8S7_9PEZI|nr:hypothetical protein VMCG_00349 [Valsa malicola]